MVHHRLVIQRCLGRTVCKTSQYDKWATEAKWLPDAIFPAGGLTFHGRKDKEDTSFQATDGLIEEE
jgi:hypothetical protein